MIKPVSTAIVAISLTVPVAWPAAQPGAAAAGAAFVVSSTGVKYTYPSDYFTHCYAYSWLHGTNYHNGCGGSKSPQQQLASDLPFVQQSHLGGFLNVLVSLDQLFDQSRWSASSGFGGWDSLALTNLDDALHQYARAGMKVELTLGDWSTTCDPSLTPASQLYGSCLRLQALDGLHPQMRQNYLAAIQQLTSHLAADPQDLAAIGVINTQNEAYYQMDVYFNTLRTYGSNSHLGNWNYSLPSWPASQQCAVIGNTVCTGGSSGKGCVSGSGAVDTGCVDVNITYPWLRDLYTTIKAAAPGIPVTVSGVGELLTTDTSPGTGQQHWISLYAPVADVFDIHLYNDAPWTIPGRWASWVNLPKPYFVGEAGCTTNHDSCTYNSGPLSAPLKWWLDNLTQHYGARSVVVEDHNTVWKYTYSNSTGIVQQLTPSGQYVQQLNLAIPATSTPTASPTTTWTSTPTGTAVPAATSTNTPIPPATAEPTATSTAGPTATNTPPTMTTSVATVTGTPAPASGMIFTNSFDTQSTGAVAMGSGANQFTQAVNPVQLNVENTVASSPSNALSVSIAGGKPSFVAKQYAAGTLTHELKFSIQVGSDFTLPAGDSMVLAQTLPSASPSSPGGQVDLALSGSGSLFVDYFDSANKHQYIWTNGTMSHGAWHTLDLTEQVGLGTGSLVLSLDGTMIVNAHGIDTGSTAVGSFALGNQYSSTDPAMQGHLFLDDVMTSGAASSSTPTAQATTAPLPTVTNTALPTSTATLAATDTPVPTPTNTAVPSPTATQQATATATLVPSATRTLPPSATPTALPTATRTAVPTPTGSPAISHVFVILMENHNWSQLATNSSHAPYLTGTLLPQAAHAEQYYNPPATHPSLPNYLWLEAGTGFGIKNDLDPYANHQSTTAHLTTLLSRAGVSWKSYQENISGSRCPLASSSPYAAKHNPFVYFDDVTGNRTASSAVCLAHVRPYGELATDLAGQSVPRYSFITPNLCDDMHDSCPPLNDPIKQGDSWLAQAVPPILHSRAYQEGGALLITWDEGEGGDGPIGMVVLSPYAKPGGYASHVHYTHSSTLRTLQEIFGVGPLLGDAANATDLSDLFTVKF